MKYVKNPPNPWATHHVEWVGEPPEAELQVYEERAKSILSKNTSPDVPFSFGINPYRGCFHGCAYCYARPTHQYLDFGAGTDFERRIVVKTNAAELLREAFEAKSWTGETLAFSGITDCYQPIEASYGLTRACLEVCAEFRNPVAIITKGSLIRRDLELLVRLHEEAMLMVWVTIPFEDDALGRAIEPHASMITQRFKTVKILADAGLRVGVSVSPLIPGLSDAEMPRVLARAAECGAERAFMIPLRLPAEVGPVFEQRLREALPDRADRVLHAVEEIRGGKRNDSRFGQRMTGQGPRWEAIRQLFHATCRRHGLNSREYERPETSTFRRPTSQLSLLD